MSAKNVFDTIDIDTAFELIALEELLTIRAPEADPSSAASGTTDRHRNVGGEMA